MIYGTITGGKQMVAQFQALPGKVKAQADATVDKLGLQLEREVKQNYLTGQVLKVRTDRLRGSISRNHKDTRSHLETTPTSAYAIVGTNVEYAAVHEYGFDGNVTIKAHTRRAPARRGAAKRGKKAATGIANVRSFTRHMRMPKRAYLAPAFAAFKPKILAAFDQMLGKVIKEALRR